MKRKIGVVCLLLIFVYCLSAVCAADLNQTTDDMKTNDENVSNAVFKCDDDYVYCNDTYYTSAADVAEEEIDSNLNDNLGCSEFNYVPQEPPKKELKPVIPFFFTESIDYYFGPYHPFISVPIHSVNETNESNEMDPGYPIYVF